MLVKVKNIFQKIQKSNANQYIDWVSFFNGISTFVSYLMPNLFLQKNNSGTV